MASVRWESVDRYFHVVDWGNASSVAGVIVVIACRL